MRIAVPREIKRHEYRVGMTPFCVSSYIAHGHHVAIEENAGLNAGFEDALYVAAGAELVHSRQQLFAEAEMIVKVKEPLAEEYDLFHSGQLLYTYLHLAADRALTDALLGKGVNSVAYETIETADRQLPCLTPMSAIAGRLAIQEGAKYLEKPMGGRGVLLGGVPGVARGSVMILGGGVVGLNACKMAVGLGARVTILDIDARRLAYFDDIFGNSIETLMSTEANITELLPQMDLVIGAVLIPGAKAPHLIRRKHLALMQSGSVIVDVSVDQGGCVETTHPTTHDDPIFVVDDVVHYCVANMPGAVPVTSTRALTSATLSYGIMLANLGVEAACDQSRDIRHGLNIYCGKLMCKEVAQAFDLQYGDSM